MAARQLAADCPTRVLVAVLRATMFVFRVVRDDCAELTFVLSVLTWDWRLFLASAACWTATAAASPPPRPRAMRAPS